MPVTKIRRSVTAAGLEVRSSSDSVTVEGYASTFNQPYDMGWYQETVAPGAFSRTLGRNPDVRLLVNHDGLPLARTTSRTLEIAQDSTGLHMRSTLDAKDPDVKRLVPKMQRGDLNEMSFAFGVIEDEWSDDHEARTLRALNLDGGDVSIVTYPANPNATIQLRSRVLEAGPDKLRALHRNLVDGPKTDLAVQLRALLENLAVEDDANLAALAGIADWPIVEPDPDEAERSLAVELELRRRRIAIERLR